MSKWSVSYHDLDMYILVNACVGGGVVFLSFLDLTLPGQSCRLQGE